MNNNFELLTIDTVTVKIQADDNIFVPMSQTDGAAGYDLRCNLKEEELVLEPQVPTFIDIGIRMEIPTGYHGKITCRSSIGAKGVIIPNSPGIVDSDYRDNVKVLFMNMTKEKIVIKNKSRIAQILIEKNTQVYWKIVPELSKTARGKGGFGSTGEK